MLVLPLDGAQGAVLTLDAADANLDALLRVLRAESAPISSWLHAAHYLLAAGREGDFTAVLEEAVERPVVDIFAHIQALCTLAEFTAQQAAVERERRQRVVLLSRSTDLCHRAQRLSYEEQLPELVLGQVALIKVGSSTMAGRRRHYRQHAHKPQGACMPAAQTPDVYCHSCSKQKGMQRLLHSVRSLVAGRCGCRQEGV